MAYEKYWLIIKSFSNIESKMKGGNRMNTLKEEAIHAIETLPNDVKLDDIMYRLYVIGKVMTGRENSAKGKSVSVEQLEKEIESW
jgi:hypothetical protein